MSGIDARWVRTKSVAAKAVQFDGTAEHAQAIKGWMEEAGMMFDGHFRAGAGPAAGALFIPTPQGVWRMDAGGWVVRLDGVFLFYTAERFADAFEAAPGLLN